MSGIFEKPYSASTGIHDRGILPSLRLPAGGGSGGGGDRPTGLKAVIPLDGLVALWDPSDTSKGTGTLTDIHSNNHIQVGGTRSAVDGYLSLNGAGFSKEKYVKTGDPLGAPTLTVFVAFRQETGGAAKQYLFSIGDAVKGSSLAITLGSTGAAGLETVQAGSSTSLQPAGFAATGEWHSVIGSATDGKQRVWLDGTLVSEGAKAGTLEYAPGGADLSFGKMRSDMSSNSYTGSFAIVAVYNRVLTEEERTKLHNGVRSWSAEHAFAARDLPRIYRGVLDSPEIPKSGLVAAWDPWDTVPGAQVLADVMSGYHGRLGQSDGPDSADPTRDYAAGFLSFNGSQIASVSDPEDGALRPGAITIIQTVRPHLSKPGAEILLGKGGSYSFSLDSNEGVPGAASVHFGTANGEITLTGPQNISANQWLVLGATATDGDQRLFYDAREVANAAWSGALLSTADALAFGGAGAVSPSFRGDMGPVLIYNRPLSLAEINRVQAGIKAYAKAKGRAFASILDGLTGLALYGVPTMGLISDWDPTDLSRGDQTLVDLVGGHHLGFGTNHSAADTADPVRELASGCLYFSADEASISPRISNAAHPLVNHDEITMLIVFNRSTTTTTCSWGINLGSTIRAGVWHAASYDQLYFTCAGTQRSLRITGGTPANEWHCTALTAKDGEQVAYMDGVQGATSVHAGAMHFTLNTDFCFGRQAPSNSTNQYTGRIGRVLFYNRALSQAEVVSAVRGLRAFAADKGYAWATLPAA